MARVARTTFASGHMVVHEGRVFRDDDPVVVEFPTMFVDVDEWLRVDAPVEQATAAPGERKRVRRG